MSGLLFSGEWTSPSVTGTPPSAYLGFSFTLVGSRAVLYCEGDVYCFDIDKKVSDSVSDAGKLVSPQEIDTCME